jgi:hypothetical protein
MHSGTLSSTTIDHLVLTSWEVSGSYTLTAILMLHTCDEHPKCAPAPLSQVTTSAPIGAVRARS